MSENEQDKQASEQAPPADPDVENDADAGRRLHYGEFYGLKPLPDGPLLLVHGNCQAESLRVLLELAGGEHWNAIRIPPVHELQPDEVPLLQKLLAQTYFLVAQPIVENYHDLPLGTAQVEALLPAGARMCRVPAIRWAATIPAQTLIRAPGIGDPPVVPYHDLRVLRAAACEAREVDLAPLSDDAVRIVRDESIRQLQLRQEHHGTIDVVGLLEGAGASAVHTINHPGNEVLLGVAQSVLDAFDVGGTVVDPGRVLLGNIRAPILASTLEALDLPIEIPATETDPLAALPREDWLVGGETVSDPYVASEQLRWYYENPAIIDAGLKRHGELMKAIGL